MSTTERVDARYCRRIEAATIAGLILQPPKLDVVRDWLQPVDFTVQHYGRWYAIAIERRDQGLPIDEVALLTELRHRGDLGPDGRYALELATITERMPIAGDPVYYARAVLEESVRRELTAAGLRLARTVGHGDGADVLTAVRRAEHDLHSATNRWHLATADGPASHPALARG